MWWWWGWGHIYGALDWLATLAKIESGCMGTVGVVYTLSAIP